MLQSKPMSINTFQHVERNVVSSSEISAAGGGIRIPNTVMSVLRRNGFAATVVSRLNG